MKNRNRGKFMKLKAFEWIYIIIMIILLIINNTSSDYTKVANYTYYTYIVSSFICLICEFYVHRKDKK